MYRASQCHHYLANSVCKTLLKTKNSRHPRRLASCSHILYPARSFSLTTPTFSTMDSDMTSSIQESFPEEPNDPNSRPNLSDLRSSKPRKPSILPSHTPNDKFRINSKYYGQAKKKLYNAFTRQQIINLCEDLKAEDLDSTFPSSYKTATKDAMVLHLMQNVWNISDPNHKESVDDSGVQESKGFKFTEAEIKIFTRQGNTHLSHLIRKYKLEATINGDHTLVFTGSNTALQSFGKELERLRKHIKFTTVECAKIFHTQPLPPFLLDAIAKQSNAHILYDDMSAKYNVTFFESSSRKNNVRHLLTKAHVLENDRLHTPLFVEPSSPEHPETPLESVQKSLMFLPCSGPSRPEWWQTDITNAGASFRRVVTDSGSRQENYRQPVLLSGGSASNMPSSQNFRQFLDSCKGSPSTYESERLIVSFGLGVFDPSLIEEIIKVRIFTEEDLASCTQDFPRFRPMWLPFSPFGFVKSSDRFNNNTVRRTIYRPIKTSTSNANQYLIQEYDVIANESGIFQAKPHAILKSQLVTQNTMNVLTPGRSCDLQFIYQQLQSLNKDTIYSSGKHSSFIVTPSELIEVEGTKYIRTRDLYVRRMEISEEDRSEGEEVLSRVAEEIHSEPHSSARPYTTSQIIAPGLKNFSTLYQTVHNICQEADNFQLYS